MGWRQPGVGYLATARLLRNRSFKTLLDDRLRRFMFTSFACPSDP
jgi:hypothetical protein